MATPKPLSQVTALPHNDPDHHDVFPGGKAGTLVRLKPEPTIAEIFSACLSLQKHQADYTAVSRETGIPRSLVSQIANDYRAAWLSQSTQKP